MNEQTASTDCKCLLAVFVGVTVVSLVDTNKMQDRMNEHDKEMMKVTKTLDKQIKEKEETIEKYKLILKKKKEEAESEKGKIKDTFDSLKKGDEKK